MKLIKQLFIYLIVLVSGALFIQLSYVVDLLSVSSKSLKLSIYFDTGLVNGWMILLILIIASILALIIFMINRRYHYKLVTLSTLAVWISLISSVMAMATLGYGLDDNVSISLYIKEYPFDIIFFTIVLASSLVFLVCSMKQMIKEDKYK